MLHAGVAASHVDVPIDAAGWDLAGERARIARAIVGAPAMNHATAAVVFDDNTNFGTTDEKMHFLNCDFLYLVQHKEAQWTTDEEKKPVNQDAVVIPMYWMGNMVTTNRARQGVLFDAA